MALPLGSGVAKPKPPPPPRPSAPPSHTDASTSGGDYGRKIVQRYQARQATAPPTHTDVTSGGYPGTSKAATAKVEKFKASPAYAKSIIDTFNAQSQAQQKAILKGAASQPNLQESKILAHFLQVSNPRDLSIKAAPLNLKATGGPLESLASAQLGVKTSTLGQVFQHAGEDLWNLPMGMINAFGKPGLDALTLHFGQAGKDFVKGAVDPMVQQIIQTIHDPIGQFKAHPLNTLWIGSGLLKGADEAAGAVARSGAVGKAAAKSASLERSPLDLGIVTPAARDYAKGLVKNRLQKAGEDAAIAGPKPAFMPQRMADAFTLGRVAHLHRMTDEETSAHQASYRAARRDAEHTLRQHAPSSAARDVVSHALQYVIRPGTEVQDALQEIGRLKRAQRNLKPLSTDLKWNRAQIASLQKAVDTPGALEEATTAAAHLRPQLLALDDYLVSKGLLDPKQAERSRLMPYAQAHMDAQPSVKIPAQFLGDRTVITGLRRAEGGPLETSDILAHMRANGIEDQPAFVEHLPGKVSAGRFYKAYKLARGSLGTGKRTGKAFAAGTYDHTYSGLVGQLAHRATTASRATLHDVVSSNFAAVLDPRFLEAIGIKRRGLDFTAKEAARIQDAAAQLGHALTPIRRGPIPLADELAGHTQNDFVPLEEKILASAKQSAKDTKIKSANVRLIPTEVADRFAQQYRGSSPFAKSVGQFTQQFRRTVLPYSTHWMLQIGTESGIRSLFAGALDPRAIAAGRALAKELHKRGEKGNSVLNRTTGGTFFNTGGSTLMDALKGRGGRNTLDVRNPNPNALVAAAKAFPPSRALIAAHNYYATLITSAVYSLEHAARVAGLGKLARDEIGKFSHDFARVVRTQGEDIARLADSMTMHPELTAKLGRQIDDLFGKYSKFTPTQRALVQTAMPFLPWYLNAAKYVLWTLPKDHPVARMLQASMSNAVQQDIAEGKKLPLSLYAMQEIARLSPWGIFTPPSSKMSTGSFLAGQHILDAIFPQGQGAYNALMGRNIFGTGPLSEPPNKLTASGKPSKAKQRDTNPLSGASLGAAAGSTLESIVPGLRIYDMLQAGGRKTYGTSTPWSPQIKKGQKPGSLESGLLGFLNPLRSVQGVEATPTQYSNLTPAQQAKLAKKKKGSSSDHAGGLAGKVDRLLSQGMAGGSVAGKVDKALNGTSSSAGVSNKVDAILNGG